MAKNLSVNNLTRQIAQEEILNNQRRESFKSYIHTDDKNWKKYLCLSWDLNQLDDRDTYTNSETNLPLCFILFICYYNILKQDV